MMLEITIGPGEIASVSAVLDGEGIDYSANFPPTLTAEQIRAFVEKDLFGEYIWTESQITDNR